MTRGGGVQLFRALGLPASRNGHLYALAAVAVAAAAAFFIVGPLTRGMLRLIGRLDYRHFSLGALALCIALVAGLTGAAGLLVMGVGTGLGLLPLLYGSRRMNCLGIILLPVACNMSGIGPLVAMGLGLMK
jgi:putative membrane protein